jgi:hypothetical protein
LRGRLRAQNKSQADEDNQRKAARACVHIDVLILHLREKSPPF